MTDKVQRIRQEIEKRLKCLEEIKLRRELAAAEIGDIACCKYLLSFIDFLQKEPETKFKIGDRIRLKGTTVKGDTIIKIYTSEVGNTYFEFKNSDIASADLDWELVEEPKKCMFTKEEFTEEDRKILCEDCEEECEYAKKEEPVSGDLGEYINKLSKQFPEVSFAKLSRIAVRVAKWQKGNIWKPADGDDLPEIDREVIVLLNNGRVAFGHRPPEYWDGKDIITGKVTRNYVERYDKGLWNIPNVKYWLDVNLQKQED